MAEHASLPIDPVIPALRDALDARGVAVLQAPPGAGKTTRVPVALLGERWLGGRKIVMLEPRRLAARAAASFMARQMGERAGETVGYRVRLDTRVGPRTRVEVVTEGVLARMIQSDPALEDVGLLIFDEFHERSLDADLGLALALQTRDILRDDLRLLVMSATLHGAAVARLLGDARGDAPIVTSEGRAFPVETVWRQPRAQERVEQAVARTVREALGDTDGDVLVFLPGQAEIRRAAALLEQGPLPAGARVMPLYGNLPLETQDEAIAPSPRGARKVVLATSIAETSLTIEGVRVVVDSGLSRVPRFSPRSGMTRLETVRASRASADQRRGRAGRVAPGVCYRLWSEGEDAHLVPHALPEIAEADLAPLALELAEAGIVDPDELRWLDPPPRAAYAQARELLAELGALDGTGRITAHGRRMAAFGTQPRLAHMLLRGAELGHARVACDLAALLGERDVVRAEGAPPD
ncbi:MAG TPA: ATP-dependent helicase HrpB, partial [Gemmatimonadales bacterium]